MEVPPQTGSERLIWAQGSPSTLRAITTTIAGVKLTLAAAICWENYMPLLRYSLYSQNVNLYLAPTADARDTWLPLMRTIASEGRTVVLSANQCVRRKNLPPWIRGESPREFEGGHREAKGVDHQRNRRRSTITKTEDNHEITWPPADAKSSKPGAVAAGTTNGSMPVPTNALEDDDDEADRVEPHTVNGRGASTVRIKHARAHVICKSLHMSPCQQAQAPSKSSAASGAEDEDFVNRGGSCVIDPMGDVLAGPLWDVEDGGLLTVDVDFEDCERGRLDLDVAGSYSRNDAFKLTVEGLDLSPPP